MEKTFDEQRPEDGQEIEVLFPDGKWYVVFYYDDGIDGIIEDDKGNMTEIEEYKNELKWRTIEE